MCKIVIITNIPAPYRVDLFNYLGNNTDFDITVLYQSANEDNRNWKAKNITHKYIILKSKTIKIRNSLDNKYIHIPINILDKLNKINPDIVIGSEYNPTVFLAFKWSCYRGKKFISWSDGTLNSERNINIFQKMLRKHICQNANAFIASSSMTKKAQLSYGADENKVFISYLTIDIKEYLIDRKMDKKRRIIFVGRLVKTKGIDLLLEAVSQIKDEYELNIIGDGPEYNNIINTCKEKKIDNRVILHGNKSSKFIIEMYSKSDMLVLPSRQDCFGLVITEAMCAGLPIIASKYADGAYDLIEEGENGFIVDPYDTQELSYKIIQLLRDEDLNLNMGYKSKKYVEKFSIESVAEKFINAIKYIK